MPFHVHPHFKKLFSAYRNRKEKGAKDAERDKMKTLFVSVALFSVVFGFVGGGSIGGYMYWKAAKELEALRGAVGQGEERVIEKETVKETVIEKEYIPQTTQEEKVIGVVEEVSPAVVSIIITKNVAVLEQVFRDPLEEFFGPSPFQIPQLREKGIEKREVGGGSGFLISADGLIVTNKHVVLDDDAEYTVLTNEGGTHQAEVLARDPVQDLAILKVSGEEPFPFARLGDSDGLQIGQTVIAIGNALGEFRNTVSSGVISGLGRTITASDGNNFVETIEDVIQTDAAINRGNSGGPLLNLAGEVIGVNTATVLDAQSIGFAIPVNKLKRDLEQVRELGKIVYPFLGVRYIIVTEALKQRENLPVDYGALVVADEQGPAVVAGSAAEKAGLQSEDIILEVNGEKITQENSLAKMIQAHDPNDTIVLKVLRQEQELTLEATLGER